MSVRTRWLLRPYAVSGGRRRGDPANPSERRRRGHPQRSLQRRIAAETGYEFRFSAVNYRGAPLSCAKPGGRGVFGNAVLTKTHIASSADAPYVAQNGVEERRWICVTTTEQVNVCTSHLTTAGTDAGTAHTTQCGELTAVLQRFANDGPTIFAGDVNRLDSCAPDTFWNETDAAATQARGIQHVTEPHGRSRSRWPRSNPRRTPITTSCWCARG